VATDGGSVVVTDGGSAPTASIEILGLIELCPGETTLLQASGDGTFVWNNGAQSSQIEVDNGGNYTVTVSNDCGSDVSTVFINPLPAPFVFIAQGDMAALCGDETLTLLAVSNTPVIWSNGIEGNSFIPAEPGVYVAYTENQCGSAQASVTVVEGNVTALFEADVLSGEPPLFINFDNNSEGADFYQWSVNGHPQSESFNFNSIFDSPGVYNISLQAADSLGCRDYFNLNIEVSNCEPLIYIPNTFTPNGDGVNDLFKAEHWCVDNYEMVILNRWGNEVFRGTQETAWDGNDGSDFYSSNGVYVYTIHYTDLSGKVGQKQGTIAVVR
jgi:gliding motility-associated-like protein